MGSSDKVSAIAVCLLFALAITVHMAIHLEDGAAPTTWVARHAMDTEKPITDSDLLPPEGWIFVAPLPSRQKIVGRYLREPLAAGQAVWPSDTLSVPSQGEEVGLLIYELKSDVLRQLIEPDMLVQICVSGEPETAADGAAPGKATCTTTARVMVVKRAHDSTSAWVGLSIPREGTQAERWHHAAAAENGVLVLGGRSTKVPPVVSQ